MWGRPSPADLLPQEDLTSKAGRAVLAEFGERKAEFLGHELLLDSEFGEGHYGIKERNGITCR